MKTLFLCLILLACSGEDPAADPVCEAGKVEACACPGQNDGAQTCAGDGSKWGTCDCATGGEMSPCGVDDDCLNGFYCAADVCAEQTVVGGGESCSAPGTICDAPYVCDGSNCVEPG